MITEDYVSFETAKLLKEKGFDEPCLMCYTSDKKIENYGHYNSYKNSEVFALTAPTIQMAMKWLREVHNIDIVIDAAVGILGVKVYFSFISTYKPLKDEPSKVHQIKRGICYKDDKGIISELQQFESYEEAIEAAIRYCIENLI